MDPVVVKAFVALLGVYPVGTLAILDTFELAIVHAVNPNPEAMSRPIVPPPTSSASNAAQSSGESSCSSRAANRSEARWVGPMTAATAPVRPAPRR